MAVSAPKPAAMRVELRATLTAMALEGKRLDPDDLTARGLEQAINGLWADEPEVERQDIAALYAKLVRPPRVPPVAIEEVVGDCWFGRFMHYAREGKAPPHMFFGAALGLIAGGICARGEARIEWSVFPGGLHPNLYILLVCGSGIGKSVVLSHAKAIIQPALNPNVLPNEGSHQGYADCLRARWNETGVAADGIIIADEMRTLISAEKYKSEAAVWLTEWYQQTTGRWARALRSEKRVYEFYNPRVSIVGASTTDWLHKMPPEALAGGFLYRFLWFVAEEGRWGKARPDFDSAVAATLSADLATIVVPESLELSRKSESWLDAWYANDHRDEWERNMSQRFRGWLERKQASLLKLAAIQHIVEHHTGPLCVKCLTWGRGVVDWLDSGVRDMQSDLGTSDESAIYQDIKKCVRRLARRGIAVSRKKIIRSGLRNKYQTPKIDRALGELVKDGDLRTAGTTVMEGSNYELVDEG